MRFCPVNPKTFFIFVFWPQSPLSPKTKWALDVRMFGCFLPHTCFCYFVAKSATLCPRNVKTAQWEDWHKPCIRHWFLEFSNSDFCLLQYFTKSLCTKQEVSKIILEDNCTVLFSILHFTFFCRACISILVHESTFRTSLSAVLLLLRCTEKKFFRLWCWWERSRIFFLSLLCPWTAKRSEEQQDGQDQAETDARGRKRSRRREKLYQGSSQLVHQQKVVGRAQIGCQQQMQASLPPQLWWPCCFFHLVRCLAPCIVRSSFTVVLLLSCWPSRPPAFPSDVPWADIHHKASQDSEILGLSKTTSLLFVSRNKRGSFWSLLSRRNSRYEQIKA